MAFLKAYNPHELSAATVLSVVTGREEPLERILSIVRDNLEAPTMQHVIVSAPRGYGKSFFLRYIEIKIAEIVKAEVLPIAMVLLPEELPHVKEPDTLLREIRRTFLDEPTETVGVRWVEDDGEAWDAAVDELNAAIAERFGEHHGLLVAGVENFDLLLRKAFRSSAQAGRLRELLTRRGNRIMLIAASARGAIDKDYDRPLFKAFDEIAFEPWTLDQCVDFFKAQRIAAKKPPLTEGQIAKAKAVATYIGGTPRLATLIGEALLEDDPLRAADVLERLVDELTPYYKDRIEVLPSRSQALLDALLRGGENCSATELARRVGAPNQPAIAAPLDELKRDLVVTGEKAPGSAEVLLRVTDRVFAHYYRKRILNHGKETCPLEALVDLLAVIYSPEEKKQHAEKLAALGLAREAALFERLRQVDQKRVAHATVATGGKDESAFEKLIAEWDRITDEGRFAEGLATLENALHIARTSGTPAEKGLAARHMGWTLGRMNRHEEAIAVIREAAAAARRVRDLGEEVALHRDLAWNLGRLDKFDEAVAAARQAVELAQRTGNVHEQEKSLRYLAEYLGELGKHTDSIAAAREALELAERVGDLYEQAVLRRSLAWNLGKLGKYDEGAAAAREAAESAERMGDLREQAMSRRYLAWNLCRLGKHNDALTVARESVELAERVGDFGEQMRAHVELSRAFNGLGKYEKALAAAYGAAEKAKRTGILGDQSDAFRIIALNLNGLGKNEEALAAARNAAETAAQSGKLYYRMLAACAILMISADTIDLDHAFTSYEFLIANAAYCEPDAAMFFDRIARVATAGLAWPRLVAMLSNAPQIAEKIAKSIETVGAAGRAVANVARAGNRDSAVTMIRHMVTVLDQAIETASDTRLARLWATVLDASADEIATQVQEVAFLSEVAEILSAHSRVPARATALIAAAANYHATGRDPAALARLDPDLATTLTAAFPAEVERPKKERNPRTRKGRKPRGEAGKT